MINLKGDREQIKWGTLFPVLPFIFILWLMLLVPGAVWSGEIPPDVQRSFDQFKKEWFNKLSKHCHLGKDYVTVSKEKNGRFVARYKCIRKNVSTRLKHTGSKTTPYVAVLKYSEDEYISMGDTPEKAKNGPFRLNDSKLVTEIFPYVKGKWRY